MCMLKRVLSDRDWVKCNRVADLRRLLGMTQRELADLVGTSKNTISSIELGDTFPNVFLAQRIAYCLDEDTDAVFYLRRRE